MNEWLNETFVATMGISSNKHQQPHVTACRHTKITSSQVPDLYHVSELVMQLDAAWDKERDACFHPNLGHAKPSP